MALLKLENVSKFYKTDTTVTVGMEKVNLEFSAHEFVAITGESGSGKSTLLNVLSGLDSYEDGELYINGEETSHFLVADWEKFRSANIGFVFQNYNIIDSYTVLQNVMLALEVQGVKREDIKPRAVKLIDDVGLKTHLHHRASKLSGGQKQRLSIARALAKDCPILIADEPTGNLDSKTGEHIIKLLHKISKDKLVLTVTHNYDQVKNYVTRKIKMHDGQVVEDKSLLQEEGSLNSVKKHSKNKKTGAKTKSKSVAELQLKQPVKIKLPTLFRFAVRDLFATPKRLIFSVLVQTVIMSMLVLMYSSQMMSINGITNFYRSYVYSFQTENTVVLQKYDTSDFSEQELTQLEGLDYVQDATTNIEVLNSRLDWIMGTEYLSAKHAGMYEQSDLSKGHLPVAENEILLSKNLQSYYNQTVSVNVRLYYSSPLVTYNMQVVGIVNDDTIYNNMFLSRAFFDNEDNVKQIAYLDLDYSYLEFTDSVSDSIHNEYFWDGNSDIVVDQTLSGNTVGYSYGALDSYYTPQQITDELDIAFYVTANSKSVKLKLHDITVVNTDDTHPTETSDYIFISPEIMQEIEDYLISKDSAVLIVRDYYDGTEVVNQLSNNTYRIYYPFMIEDFITSLTKLIRSFFAVIILLVVGMFGYAIVHWMLRNVMQSKKRDFAIFRSIGTNENTLAWLVVLEQLLIGVISLILTALILFGLQFFVASIAVQLRYIQLLDYIILFVALIGFSVMLGFRFNKKIFKQSVIKTLNS